MKKIVILVTSILTFVLLGNFNLLAASKIVVERGHGGTDGYDKVNEWHFYDPTCQCDVHKLSCWDPGYTRCSWMHPPQTMRLIDYADEQIKNGKLNGVYEEIIEGIRHVVEWSATDINNCTITETVYD